MFFDYSHLEFSRPVKQVKTINVEPIPLDIFDGMTKYEDAARGFSLINFERDAKSPSEENTPGPTQVFVNHRPKEAQVSQVYRLPADPASTDLQRITHFDIGSGRTIAVFRPIIGEDWRGFWRGGGAIMAMDTDGNEMFQLWRYWEDSLAEKVIPKIDGELDNSPGTGRFERLTQDGFKYSNVLVSESNKLLAFASNKENKKDTLIYVTKLINSETGSVSSEPFNLPSSLITPPGGQGTSRWVVESISINDRLLLLTKFHSALYRPMYIVDISGEEPSSPEPIILPHSTEKREQTSFTHPTFSRDPAQSELIYLITNAYGDFKSVVTYDTKTHSVLHITTPEPNLNALRPISWEAMDLKITKESIFFRANVEGWSNLYVMPLVGPHRHVVIEVRFEWEGGQIIFMPNSLNGKPNELVLKLASYRSQGRLAHLDISDALQRVEHDGQRNAFISASLTEYRQTSSVTPAFRTLPPKLLKYMSFDGLEIPVMYYHPKNSQSIVPLVISIHGGPESQAHAHYRSPIHSYLLNEMDCAVMYPNVRGSSGYGKRFMAADDVEKREDSVKDIEALLDHIDINMKTELDSKRIAVMGGSYGGYMVFACLTHFSYKLVCGVANFGIAHWPSFLQNTAAHRRDGRRLEYGDETIPEIREFLERISPLNNASKISVPLSIAHGETDSRVTVEEAIRMWDIVSKNGIYAELMVCEKEGHGFKQKSVIEFTNAAKIHFLQRFLLTKPGT